MEHVDSSDDDRLGDGDRFFDFVFVREGRSGFAAPSSDDEYTQAFLFFFSSPRISSRRSLFSSSETISSEMLFWL